MLFTVVKYYIEKTYYSRTGRGGGDHSSLWPEATALSHKKLFAAVGHNKSQLVMANGP